jgi:O-antigen ligase
MKGIGTANVHNDTLQFLAEFGLTGIIALGSAVGIQLYRVIRHPMRRHGLYVFILLGLVLLYVHSMIDLPFRNPAVLISSAICLAGLGCYAKMSGEAGSREQGARSMEHGAGREKT